MKINVLTDPSEYFTSIHELVRLAFPGYEVKQNSPENSDMTLEVLVCPGEQEVSVQIEIGDEYGSHQYRNQLTGFGAVPHAQRAAWIVRGLRAFTFKILCTHCSRNINPYGLLTGMRPVKAAQRLLDRLDNPMELEGALGEEYLLNREKAALVAEVARNSRPFLKTGEKSSRLISVYAGIPFCPSRCEYCSFPGTVLKNYDREIPVFLECLFREMEALGSCIKRLGLATDCVYIGGGTPSILNEADLEMFLHNLKRYFIGNETREISMEAGRPDTLSRSKLDLMVAAGVQRICINPQSMQEVTLQRIGRLHTVQAVDEIVDQARLAGFKTVNMDLIAGLQGEDMDEYRDTLQKVLAIRPENITVHSLAIKRGSRLAVASGGKAVNSGLGEGEAAVRFFEQQIKAAGYLPYYLYRQKHMRDKEENLGYALPGHICFYNIEMIEERQTILGLGGGAASKFVNQHQSMIDSFYNPKNPYFYCRDIERLVNTKVDKLEALF